MEKAHTAVTAQTARQFLEQTLGFGDAIQEGSFKSLFDEKANVLYYGSRKNGVHASLNAVSRIDWDNKHMTEGGRVFADIFSSPMGRVREFIERELAAKGLAPSDTIHADQAQRLKTFIRLLREFREGYLENIDPYADLQTSLSLRSTEVGRYNLILRAGLFSKNETMFFEFTFDQIVKGLAHLITNAQLSTAIDAVQNYLGSFGKKSKLFREITGFELSKTIVYQVVQVRNIPEEIIYGNYYRLIQDNKAAMNQRMDIIQADEVSPWSDLTDSHKTIMGHAVDIARTYVTSFIDVNTMEAKEQVTAGK
jgi:hypothetical protein